MSTATEPTHVWTRDALADHLEREVLTRARVTGRPIASERGLAASLGVSRSLVREVFRGFEQRGLLEIVPGKGAYPREPGFEETSRAMRDVCLAEDSTPTQVLQAWAAIESQAARLAARNASPADATMLDRAAAAFDQAHGVVEVAVADLAFHTILARSAANPVLATLGESISALVFETMLATLASEQDRRHESHLHRVLLDAIARRDPESAVSAASACIQRAEDHCALSPEAGWDQHANEVLHRFYGRNVPLERAVSEGLAPYLRPEAAAKKGIR